MLQVEHDAKWIKRLSALSKVYFTPTFIGAEQLDASQPAMYVGNHSMYGVLDSPMLIDYLYNEHQVAVVSIADHSHSNVSNSRIFIIFINNICPTIAWSFNYFANCSTHIF